MPVKPGVFNYNNGFSKIRCNILKGDGVPLPENFNTLTIRRINFCRKAQIDMLQVFGKLGQVLV
jgi:hypothetical protein